MAPVSLAFAGVNAIPAPQAVRICGCGSGVAKNTRMDLGEIITTISCASWAWAAGMLWGRGPRWHPSPWRLQKECESTSTACPDKRVREWCVKKYTNGSG